MIRFFITLALLISTTPMACWAIDNNIGQSVSRFDLSTIEAGAINVAQGDGWIDSAVVRYAPNYHLSPNLSAGVSFGATPLKFSDSNHFWALEFMSRIDYLITLKLNLGFALGTQDWSADDTGNHLILGPRADYLLKIKSAPWFRSIWLAYFLTFQSQTAREMSLGVGVQL